MQLSHYLLHHPGPLPYLYDITIIYSLYAALSYMYIVGILYVISKRLLDLSTTYGIASMAPCKQGITIFIPMLYYSIVIYTQSTNHSWLQDTPSFDISYFLVDSFIGAIIAKNTSETLTSKYFSVRICYVRESICVLFRCFKWIWACGPGISWMHSLIW